MKLAALAFRAFACCAAISISACSSSSSSSASSNQPRACDAVAAPASCACLLHADSPPKKPVPVCDATLLGGPALCCQSSTSCSCVRVGCHSSAAGGCACNASYTETDACSGTPCCNWVGTTSGTCSCGGSGCPSDAVQVTACTPDVLACAPGQTRVSKCEPQERSQ